MELTAASFILTEDCTLACDYCYEKGKNIKTHVMTEKTAKDAVDFLISNALKETGDRRKIDVTYFGGEPLMNLSVMRFIMEYGYKRTKELNIGFGSMLVSNATIWNDEYEDFILRWKELSGNNINIQLSIDGIPKIQDIHRYTITGGKSSIMVEINAKKHVEFFKKHGIKESSLQIHSVVSKASLPYLNENDKYFKETLGIKKIWHLLLHEENWDNSDVEIYKKELDKIGSKVLSGCIESNNMNLYNLASNVNLKRDKKPSATCGAGKDFCTIGFDGIVYPCHAFAFEDRDSAIGDIYNGIDESARQIYLDVTMENMIGIESCSTCSNNTCKICLATNKKFNKNMVLGFPKYCKMSKAEYNYKKELNKEIKEVFNISDNKNTKYNINYNPDNNKQNTCKPSNDKVFSEEQLKIIDDNIIKMTQPAINDIKQKINNNIKIINNNGNDINKLKTDFSEILKIVSNILDKLSKEDK